MRKNRSIGYKLKRARDPALRLEIAHRWADEWHAEHIDLIERLKRAIDNNDMDGIRMTLAELRTLTEHKHIALHKILTVFMVGGEE